MSFRNPSNVSPTTGRLQSGPSGCTAAISASRTTPTECVFVSAIGVVSRPESRTHSSPVSSPLPLIRWQPAKSGSGGGATTVTPVRTSSPSIERRVADPDAGHVRDRVLRPGPQPADLDAEVTGARLHAAYTRTSSVSVFRFGAAGASRPDDQRCPPSPSLAVVRRSGSESRIAVLRSTVSVHGLARSDGLRLLLDVELVGLELELVLGIAVVDDPESSSCRPSRPSTFAGVDRELALDDIDLPASAGRRPSNCCRRRRCRSRQAPPQQQRGAERTFHRSITSDQPRPSDCRLRRIPRRWRSRRGSRRRRPLGARPRAARGVRRNPSTSMLYTHALERREGRLAEGGPLAVDTGRHTGRSPKDKFVVREPGSEDRIWWGDVNAEFVGGPVRRAAREGHGAPRGARPLRRRRLRRRRPEAPDRRPRRDELPVPRAVRADDVHRPDRGGAARFEPQALVLHAPGLEAEPETDGTRSGTFVVLHPSRRRS